MLMQKHSPITKVAENDDVNVDLLFANGHFFSGRNTSVAGSECNDEKSNDACSSDDESHEQENTEQENQSSQVDGCQRGPSSTKTKKANKVKLPHSHDDKTGIKLKIRRTNPFSQDENHVVVDHAERKRRRRCKPGEVDGIQACKRTKVESEDESRVSVAVNTASKGTDMDGALLGPCQAGTRLSLESVVLMETKSGIVIVSVEWRGKTLMGALMEAERFQMGSLEKDSIYRPEKPPGLSRRATRRKSKNLFSKKKRKLVAPEEQGGTENEAGNSDGDTPYSCDKDGCHMRFAELQTLRVHIYELHRGRKTADAASLRPATEERNTFSPAYSDISDANEAPVLENETVSVSQPPVNLSMCHNATLLAASNRLLFSPSAPALQPEVSVCLPRQLPHMANYAGIINGLIHSPPTHHKPTNHRPPNCGLTDVVEDLSMNGNIHKFSQKLRDSNNENKSAQNILNCHQKTVSRHPHHHMHSSNHNPVTNGFSNNHNSKHSDNGVALSHNLPYVSFPPSISNQNKKYNYPINHAALFHQSKF